MRRRPVLAAAIALSCSLPLAEPASAANCAPLEMRLMQLQARGASGLSEAREVRAMLEACNGNAPATGFYWGEDPEPEPRVQVSRTVRTLCVRACDGYYFPISFSTTRDRLENDEAACKRQCPAGNASLFYHASYGQISDQAVSISGAPYTDLENAFRYRSVLDQSCTCGTPLPDPEQQATLRPFPSVPAARGEPGSDPETFINRRGGLTFSPAAPTLIDALMSEPPQPAGVRVILATGALEQDQYLLSDVPSARFLPEEELVRRGPGEIACVSHGRSCQTR